MNFSDLRDAELAEAEKDRTSFAILEGRYYLAMLFVNIPVHVSKFGHGGDITGLIWRPIETPDEGWIFQYRFRHYAEPGNQAWGTKDTRSWYANTTPINTSESKMLAKAKAFFNVVGAMGGHEAHVLEIRGGVKKFHSVVRIKKPEWLHTGIDNETAQKGGDPEGN